MNTEKRLYLALKNFRANASMASVASTIEADAALAQYEMSLGPLPDWAVAHNITDELVEGLQLFTRNGRRHGNAHIVKKEWAQAPGTGGGVFFYEVLTDAGSIIRDMSEAEVLGGWEPGMFISSPAAVVKRFGRVPTDLLEPEE